MDNLSNVYDAIDHIWFSIIVGSFHFTDSQCSVPLSVMSMMSPHSSTQHLGQCISGSPAYDNPAF